MTSSQPPHHCPRTPRTPAAATPDSAPAAPWLAVSLLIGLLGATGSPSPANGEWPPLPDLARQVRAAWPEAPIPAAGQTNAEDYLRSLAPHVLPDETTAAPAPLLARTNAYAGAAAYLRVGEVREGLREALTAALASVQQASPVQGVILDLRFAGGTNYAAAAAAASLFVRQPVEGLRLGDQPLAVTVPENRRSDPVILLVNRETSGAAEALAAAIRAGTPPSLLVGTNTAGQARTYRVIPLDSGARIRVATAPLTLPGGKTLPDSGLVPDLAVAVAPADERLYLTNEFVRVVDGRPLELAAAATTLRLNEAELVRRRGARRPEPGLDADEAPHGARRPLRPRPEAAPAAEAPIADPVLARAVDLVAGFSQPPPPADGDSR